MKDPKNEHLKITENEGAATPSGKGDFSKGSVPLLILKLGLPIMLAEIVVVLYNIVDRAYILIDGSVIKEGGPDDIVSDPVVRSRYLTDDFRM